MCQRRNGLIEAGATLALGTQITQESPNGSDQLFSSTGPTLTGTFEQKRAHSLGIPLARIIA
jgi:hypothetical protein